MLARVWSCALAGLEGELVQVEVDIHNGLPHVTLVGLPDLTVRESKDRLYAALRNAGFGFPMARITINLAPAHVRKVGPHYDLAIALGILAASDQLPARLDDALVFGEVALDGRLRRTHGILPVAVAARCHGFHRVIVPAANAAEAALVPGLDVVAADSLKELVHHLRTGKPLPPIPPIASSYEQAALTDLSEVRGQEHARRALEIAAAGGHNLSLTGPPGGGKTMLARCLPTILPPLSLEESLEVTAVYSVAGLLPADVPLIRARPFRSPHHTISNAGLIGGGSWPRPGEVSLAHHGVLFLDELPEFDAAVLEGLRQPIEDRRVTIARAAGSAVFPASVTLVAARNPCPCGFFGDPDHACTCAVSAVLRYGRRVSGPLIDRIDLHLEVPRVPHEKLLGGASGEPSSAVRARVVAARDRQTARLRGADEDAPHRTDPNGGVPPPVALVDPAALVASIGADDALALAPSMQDDTPLAPEASWERGGPTGRGSDEPSERATRAFRLGDPRARCNAELTASQVRRDCRIDAESEALLRAAMRRLGLSARAFHRILKVARTIADLEASEAIATRHVAEALQYRPRQSA
ncbi:MAG: YifB family Mg chelatase-like AAA ATPase [Ardenticatenales bacterium]